MAVRASRERANKTLREVAAAAGITEDDLDRLEAGDPALSSFELQELAEALSTTTGGWFYDDRLPMFRGADESDAAQAAAALGRDLMLKYLALEASVG